MAKTNYQTIDEYHQAFTGETLARMQTIRAIINEAVPDAEECISYQIPCFKYHGYLLYYCAFPKHITLSYPYSDAFWEHFKADLQGYKVSKSAIQIPNDKPLPETLIKKIITFRKKENEQSAKRTKN
ncbi:Uncharacterized conserved protein YdhG, YjbR/CyaY-like superfamily, DUF1801 family [Parapedobacter composti]|uniref:Uncharacterized conserved protein YdhG, YjbR/CyaY-like superfamily, DUF1801 family n=1 Tax=Parapedobacter composti TaxID=623281 RepID=A0A1I1LLA2_9SPHI|nr:DUF1801 domain-containing protein [Parapedobacter composti]SFC73977.1 Uncharacterized conserved protein YdhG, YjbR/CyaY-like superfamily, DUF1801 family [Parapedobacter composti]